MDQPQLRGYARPDGQVGIRNYVAIIAVMDNSCPTARRVAAAVKGAVPVAPGAGRGLIGADLERHFQTLIGMGTSPNVYGAVVISLEGKTAGVVADGIAKSGRPVRAIALDEIGGTVRAMEVATRIASEMVAEAGKLPLVPLPWAELLIGVECGGSDGSSGMVSNPVTGMVADRVIERGGTVILSETLEILGGEHLLAARARNEEVGRQLVSAVEAIVTYSREHGIDVLGTNPAPDNIAGGLSTIEEKALGGIKKAGSCVLNEVVGYGVRPKEKGFIFMDAPAPGLENLTALSAAGVHLTIFSTGRGNPAANPVSPTIKVSGNPHTVKLMRDNLDVDLSGVITEGMSMDQASRILESEMLAVCAGKPVKAEVLGEVETSISRLLESL